MSLEFLYKKDSVAILAPKLILLVRICRLNLIVPTLLILELTLKVHAMADADTQCDDDSTDEWGSDVKHDYTKTLSQTLAHHDLKKSDDPAQDHKSSDDIKKSDDPVQDLKKSDDPVAGSSSSTNKSCTMQPPPSLKRQRAMIDIDISDDEHPKKEVRVLPDLK